MKWFASFAIALALVFFSGNDAQANRYKSGAHSASYAAHGKAVRSKHVTRSHRTVHSKRAVRRKVRSTRNYTGQSRQRQTRSYHSRRSGSHQRYAGGVGPRPSAWCGWWMRTQLGGGPQYNLARSWRGYGRPASPQVGAVVVKGNHVGIITGRSSRGWIVKAGNDGGTVRERVCSLSGATVRI